MAGYKADAYSARHLLARLCAVRGLPASPGPAQRCRGMPGSAGDQDCRSVQHRQLPRGPGIAATAGFGVDYVGLHGTDERIRLDTIPSVQAVYHNAILRLLGGAA